MKKMIINRRNIYLLAGMLMTSVLLIAGACKTSNKSTATTATTTTTTNSVVAVTVNVNTKIGIGTYLIDGNGHTLYWTTLDSVGQSNVTGAVLANWPIFYNSNIVVPSSLNASDFGSITRSDGSMQTTYKGRPLYYYINDQAAGSTLGQGIKGIWFAVDPSTSSPTATTTSTTTTIMTTTTTASPTSTITTPTSITTTATTSTTSTTPTTNTTTAPTSTTTTSYSY